MAHIKLRGINYYYKDVHAGKKETVLLVHGHPFDHSMWQYQEDALKNFRLVLPDLRGYGKTDYHFTKIQIEEQALDLVFLLDWLNIDKVHLMGLSMGGQIIVEFARLFPHRLRSLIICNSNPSGETQAGYKGRLELIDRIVKDGMLVYTQQDIYKYLHPATIENNEEAYQHLFNMMSHTTIEGAVASHRGRAQRRDNYSYLQQITVPVLVVAGGKDFFTPAEEMKQVAEEIKKSKFVLIENAGHLPNMEQPAAFNEVIADFLERVANS